MKPYKIVAILFLGTPLTTLASNSIAKASLTIEKKLERLATLMVSKDSAVLAPKSTLVVKITGHQYDKNGIDDDRSQGSAEQKANNVCLITFSIVSATDNAGLELAKDVDKCFIIFTKPQETTLAKNSIQLSKLKVGDQLMLSATIAKADEMVAKVQYVINHRGAYENAGQDEIREFEDIVRDCNFHYQQQCNLIDYINKGVDNLKYS